MSKLSPVVNNKGLSSCIASIKKCCITYCVIFYFDNLTHFILVILQKLWNTTNITMKMLKYSTITHIRIT